MPSSLSASYSYDLVGTVVNLSGVVLPSDDKEYLVFGFISEFEGRTYSCVFYIRLNDANSCVMAAIVVRALVTKKYITVSFNTDTPWNKEKDPSYVIAGVRA